MNKTVPACANRIPVMLIYLRAGLSRGLGSEVLDTNSERAYMNSKTLWLLPRLLVVLGLGSALADTPTTGSVTNPGVDVKLKIEKAPEGDKRPRISYLKTWFEQRGSSDIVHVTNLGTTPAQWSGRIYELGTDCRCMVPNKCDVGPICTNPNGGDTQVYTGEHRCLPILVINHSQDVGQCPSK
jgi:hypothetical protein